MASATLVMQAVHHPVSPREGTSYILHRRTLDRFYLASGLSVVISYLLACMCLPRLGRQCKVRSTLLYETPADAQGMFPQLPCAASYSCLALICAVANVHEMCERKKRGYRFEQGFAMRLVLESWYCSDFTSEFVLGRTRRTEQNWYFNSPV